MGIFGGMSKPEISMEPQPLPEEEERFDELPSLPRPRASTVITKGVTVYGAMRGDGVIQVEGTVEGEIDLTGSVVVANTGLIKGPIVADVIRIAGRVEGSITARDHLRLEKTGEMEGDITTVSLVVEDGGRLNGRSTMLKPADRFDEERSGNAFDDLQFGPGYQMEKEADEAPVI